MRSVREWMHRVWGMVGGSRRDQELEEELRVHLELAAEDAELRRDPSPEAARVARVRAGGVSQAMEELRDQRGVPLLESAWRDARLAVRGIRRNAGFNVALVGSLSLGIAATVAIFSVADAVLLRPLPYADASRLATVSIDSSISAPLFEALRERSRSLESAGLFNAFDFDLSGPFEPERIAGARVSPEIFHMVGVAPRLGRVFAVSDDRPGSENVVILGDTLWRIRFGGDPSVIGRTVTLNGAAHTIVGVMPPGFAFPNGPELPATVGPFPPAQMWRPMALADWEQRCGGCFNFAMLVRLRPGVSAAGAQSELDGIVRTVRPDTRGSITIRTLEDAVTGRVRLPLLILFAAVCAALLISCLNVASLLLARGIRRQAEIAMCISLGASRGRIVRQLLVESLVLSLISAAIALPIAWAGTRTLVSLAPAGIPRLDGVILDVRVLAFTLIVSVTSAFVFGVAPALLTTRRQPSEMLKEGGGRSTPAQAFVLRFIVAAEFALSFVLLVSAVMLARSYLTVANTPLGFRPEQVLTLRTSLPEAKYDDRRRAELVERVVEGCARLPGVIETAAVSTLPLTGESEGWGIVAEDAEDQNAYVMARTRAVTPGYFRTLGIRLLRGRDFEPSDRGQGVVIVSATAAKRLWSGIEDPVGRRLRGRPPVKIVGIVEDTRASGLDNEVRPYLYVPFWMFAPESFAIVIRGEGSLSALVPSAKAEVWRIDKDQPVTHVQEMSRIVASSIGSRWFQFVLMAIFGAFALLLAALGIYGTLSYAVAQHAREIGIRLALGASRRAVVASVLRQAAVLGAAGSVAGVVGASLLVPMMRAILYRISPLDVPVFLGSMIMLLAVAALAGLLPAIRAARLDPAATLRSE